MAETERVTIYTKSSTAEDANGDPVEVWTPTVVDGALVYELHGSDIEDADRPDGVRVRARVQLPDSAMASIGRDGLKGSRIALTDRGQGESDAYWVAGSPNYAPDMHFGWNSTIEIGRRDG